MFFRKVNLEYFIAKRSAERKSGNKPSVMVHVATISVALSVAIMILTLAIVFGFKREISRSVTGFTSEAILTDIATLNGSQNSPIELSEILEEILTGAYGAQKISPYATLQGVVRSSESVEGVILRGVDSLYDFEFLRSTLTQGELPRVASGDRSRDLLLSSSLARRLGVGVGDRLELIKSEEDKSLRRDLFKVCGLYSTGLEEWDEKMLLTSLYDVQRLNGWSEQQISGYELSFGSMAKATTACERINKELFYAEIQGVDNMVSFTAEQLYPSIFDWLKAHDVNAVVIIVIMLIVAGFNMATALLIMVLERTRMIGVLKALGMNNGSLQKIFLYRSLSITLRGLAWGNGVALVICVLQHYFHLVKLDAANYLLSYVPIELGAGWVLLLNGAMVVAIWALMLIPSRMVSRVQIEKTLKFE